jgi:phosphatidate cytidylyltransferase
MLLFYQKQPTFSVPSTILTSQLAPLLSPFSFSQSLILGLIISSMGFVGDVVMSAVKRDLGIKDYSQLIPGHGGILDRCDSLIYTAPLFFHYYAYLYY